MVKKSKPVQVTPLPSKSKKTRNGLDTHGFRKNSDSSKIVEIMVNGAIDRQEINILVANKITSQTRHGLRKNIPSLVSGLLTRLEAKGYTVESSWKLIAPDEETVTTDS